MVSRLIAGVKILTGQTLAGRNFPVFPDDTFLVSYPKSGNTWARFLLASLMNPTTTVTFRNIETLLPDASSQSRRHLKSIPKPRLIKSHQYLDPRYKKVIYIVRDPRDVVLSQYRFYLKVGNIDESFGMDQFVNCFVAGDFMVNDLNAYGSWGENVGGWLGARQGEQRFLLLRYEDMICETAVELARVAEFLGVKVTQDQINHCVEQGSPDRMRELEKLESDAWVVTKGRRKDIPFVGAAKAGGWRSNLSPDHVAQIESAWGRLMLALRYDPVSDCPHPEPIAESVVSRLTR